MRADQEQRRQHLLYLMRRYGVTCRELAALMDRQMEGREAVLDEIQAWREG